MTEGHPNTEIPTGGEPDRQPYPEYPPTYPNTPYPPYPNAAPGAQGAAPPPGGYPYATAYPGPMAPSTSGWAIASLVCAIAGFFGFFVIGHVLSVIFGHMALNEIKHSDGRLQGHGLAMAGLIISYISLGLIVLAIIVLIVVFLIVGIAASQSSGGIALPLLGALP